MALTRSERRNRDRMDDVFNVRVEYDDGTLPRESSVGKALQEGEQGSLLLLP